MSDQLVGIITPIISFVGLGLAALAAKNGKGRDVLVVSSLAQKDLRIHYFEEDLKRRDSTIAHLEKESDDKSDEIHRLGADVDSKDNEISRLRDRIEELRDDAKYRGPSGKGTTQSSETK